jgi:LuxR family transcriptional regulator, maltose regulon positive regulatory protein
VLAAMDASPYIRANHLAFHVLLARFQKDSEAVSRWLTRLEEYAATTPIDMPFSVRRLLISQGGKTERLEELQAAHKRFTESGMKLGVILTSLFLALESPASSEAMTYLAEAITLARPQNYIRLFVDEGIELVPLLRQAIIHRIEPEYTARLITIIEEEHRQSQTRQGETPDARAASSLLSERELEILKFLAEGLSKPQIAAKMIVSLNTVKTHIRHIHEKLNVQSRTQALARARELKLI